MLLGDKLADLSIKKKKKTKKKKPLDTQEDKRKSIGLVKKFTWDFL